MTLRFQRAVMAAALLAALTARGVAPETYTWKASPPTSVFGNNLNWTSENTPTANSALVFGGSLQPSVVLGGTFSAFSLEFSSSYPAYVVSSDGSTLSIGSGGVTVASGGAGAVTFDSGLPIALTANQSWTVGGTSVLIAAGGISGSGFGITKSGTGTLTLSGGNSFSGAVTIGGGVLEVSSVRNGGMNSGLGASTSAAANLILNGGTLRYTGPAETIDRLFTLGVAGGVVDASGSGPLVLDNTGAIALDPAGNTSRTLTLTGTNTGSNTLSASLADSGSDANALVKSGVGKWVLNGANTFTGTTQINAGTLSLTNVSGLGGTVGGTQVGSGATLDLNGVAVGGETLTLNGTGVGGIGAFTGTGTSSLSGAITLASNATIGGTGTLTLSGVVGGTGAMTKAGTGTLTLAGANTYSGATRILQGTLSVASLANGGATSAIGNSSNASDNLVLNGGTLRYTGTGDSTDRLFNLISSSAIDAAGTGTLNFTNAGSIDLNNSSNNRTLTLTGSGNGTLASSLTNNNEGTISLVKSGTGTWTLLSASTYSGLTQVDAGTLSITDANGLGGTAGGTQVSSGATLNLNGVAVGGESLTLNGTGVGGIGALTGTGTSSLTGGVTLQGNSKIGGAGALTLSGVVSGAGALTEAGNGSLTLAGNNTFSGGMQLDFGTLNLNNPGALGTGAFSITGNANLGNSSGSPLTLSTNNAQTWNSNFSFVGPADLNLGTGAVTLGVPAIQLYANTGTLTVGGAIGDGGNARGLNKQGGGILALSGANTFTGTVTVSNGVLSVPTIANGGIASPLGSSGSAASSLFIDGGGTLRYTGAGASTDRLFTFGHNGTIEASGAGTLALTNTGNLGIGGNNTTLILGGTGTGSLAPKIVNGSEYTTSLTKSGTGTWTLLNANTFTGLTQVNAGTLSITDANGLGGTAGGTQVSSGATLNLNGVVVGGESLTLNGSGVSGAGALTGTGISSLTGAVTLQSNSTIGGAGGLTLSGAVGGAGTLTKAGSGTLTLSGANAYAGGTVIDAGTLVLASTGSLPTGADVTVNNSGVFDVRNNQLIRGLNSGSTTSGVAIANGTTLTTNAPSGSNTFAGVISGSGSLAKSGPATLVLSGTASSYTGSTTIGTGSTLSVASLANGGVNSSIGASTSAAGNLILNGGTLLYTGAAKSTDRLFTLGSTGGTISASGSGALTLANSGAIAFSSDNAGATLTLTGTNGGNNTFGSALGDNGTGVVALSKTGAGKWVLSGAAGKTYSGQTSINAGTLADGVAGSFSPNSGIYLLGGAGSALNVNFNETIAGLGGVTSSIGSTTTLASGATLTINTANLTYAGTIAGAGGLTIAGSGTQTLQGTNTYTGTTTINSGTLSISNTSALGSASGGTVVNDGTLNLNSVSVGSEPISLSGNGVGDQGALISNGSSSLSGPITLAGSASIGGSGTLTLSGAIGESGGNSALTKLGSGTVVLSGSSSFTGPTAVQDGILRLGANNVLPATTNVYVSATDNGFATFDVSNRSQTIGALTLAGGENSSNKVTLGTGTLTLGGGVTYDAESGPYGASISSGTLALGTAGLVAGNRVVDVTRSSNAITALTIYSNISDISGGSIVGITKKGDGELLLAGNNTFAGGVSVTGGKLYVGSNAAVGSGTLSLASGTTLAPMQTNGSFDITLTNAVVNLGDCVTLGDVNAFGSLTLAGKVMVQNARDAVVKVRLVGGEDPVFFQNELSALNSGGTLTFFGGGKVVLGGATNAHDGNLAHLIADGAAIIFATTASVPGGLSNAVSVEATNGGYVGVAATSLASSPPSANAVLARIPDRSAFAGTFGFDTDKESVGGTHVYAEDLDFSGFTNSTFAIGSATSAVLAGRIKPVMYTSDGTYYEYRFGNGGGALVIQSNLSGNNTSVSVSSYAGQSLIAILRGNNSFTGNLRIENSAVVLDSVRALPTDVFVNLYDGLAYFGATEVHSTASSFINTFYSATDYGSQLTSFNSANASFVPVLGLDSHVSLVSALLGHERRFTRTISESLDFSGLSSEVYLGTLTNIDLTGALTGRYIYIDGENMTQLRLTGVKGGQLTVSSNLNANGGSASNVIVGAAGLGDDNGVVYLKGNNSQTYTRLEGGTLLVGSNSALGIGNLDVDASDSDVRPVLASNSTAGVTLANPISLTTTLQLGEANFDDHGDHANAARNKLTLSGPISGKGGLYVANGRTILSGNNSYEGGTYVKNGVLIFGSPASIPDTDTVDMTAESSGYVGIAFTSAPSGLNYTFFDHFHRNATNGTIGFDTLGDSAANEFGNIDISNFNNNVRLGSATFAKVTGTITPAGNGPYRFGGGGGLLEVSSALTNAPSSPTAPRGVVVESNSDRPLTLLLSGANTYSGSTSVNQSAVIFTPDALATVGFPATNNFSLNQGGYVGLRLTADVAGADTTTIPAFLGHFQAGTNQGFVGFDSNSTSLRQVGAAINLSGVGTGVYLGSTSNLAVSGLLTFPGGTYRFAGYKGGQLGILSTLSGAGGVKIGEANTPATFASTDGSTLSTVTLAGNNTYTGGTDFYAGRLVVGGTGTTSALGSPASPLRVQSNNFSDEGSRRLEVHSSVTAIANNIELNADLDVGGGSDFTLAGIVSGLGELYKIDNNTLTLSGNNTGFSGGIYVQQGNVRLMHANAAGTGVLQMGGPQSPAVTLGVSATVNGIFGDNATDRIYLDSGVGMTVNQTAYSQYLGTFVSNGSGTSLVFKGPSAGSPVQLRLAGSSSLFTGTTTIQSGILLVAASNSAFGPSGNVVALTGGKLAVEGDTTLSNSLTLTSGKLGGAGTIEAATTLHIGGSGSNQVVLAPGVTGPGTLNFSGARLSSIPVLSLDAGGAYQWQLMDAGNSNGGWDKVVVTGSVAIGAPESGKPAFTFKLTTVASDGSLGLASFDPSVSASWKVLTATSITGSLANLAIDTAAFQNPFVGFFGLSVNPANTELFVNFTSVPEPSTYVLLSSGLVVLAFTLRRRKSPPRG